MTDANIEALATAIQTGEVDTVTRLIEASPQLLKQRTSRGLTPIILVLYTQQAAMLPILLAHAIDLDVFEAAGAGRDVQLGALLEASAALAAAYSTDGFTALHLAAFFGQDAAAKVLLEHGADANATAENDSRVRPLHSAAAGHHLAVAGALIAAGADVDARQEGGYTALHAAAQHGDRALIDLLTASGADLAMRTDEGKTAAELATDAGHAAIAELLQPR